MRRPVLAFALAATLLAACPSGDPDPGPPVPTTQEERWLSAVDGLCGALTSAQDRDAARAAFFDRSHTALHEIASAVTPVERALAAALLEAKNRVETDLDEAAPASQLESDLLKLVGATVDALGALDIFSPGCA